MKNLKNLGEILNKEEQKSINGGSGKACFHLPPDLQRICRRCDGCFDGGMCSQCK